jgi:hypothetical protein
MSLSTGIRSLQRSAIMAILLITILMTPKNYTKSKISSHIATT